MTLGRWIPDTRGACHHIVIQATILALLFVPGAAAFAQPSTRCDAKRRVESIDIEGSPLFDDATLSAAIASQSPSSIKRLLHIGSLPCSDSLELRRDALRLAVLHRQAGWLQATASVSTLQHARGIHIRFDITPGSPALIDTVLVTGLPAAEGGLRDYARPLRRMQGGRYDRIRLDTTITAVVSRLRDFGYARVARPTVTVVVDTAKARVHVAVAFVTGPPVTVRAVTVAVQGMDNKRANLDTGDVRRLTSLEPGHRFSASDVLDAQRDLYRAESFRLVLIDTATPTGADAKNDSLIDLKISVSQGQTRSPRIGLGWATLECVRAQARYVDRQFLGVGRRLELTARASRIGVGPPADFAPGICSPALRADTQFTVLNHYLGATYSSTRTFGLPFTPVTSIYTERRSEPYAYVREVGIGAILEAMHTFNIRTNGSAGIQYENGRTKIDPAEACSRFGQCRKEEYDQAVFGRGVGIISTSVAHDGTNSAVNPSRGYRWRGELRAGQTFAKVDSSVRFYRTSGEASAYLRVLGGVFASRIQLARAFAPGARLVDGSPLIPQQERLFAGGQSTVRGFQQNLLGPLVYVVSQVSDTVVRGAPVVQVDQGAPYDRAVPRGGTALAVANVEYRRGFRWLSSSLQFVGFVDVGNVWEGGAEPFRMKDLRATPGIGLRVLSSLGPFRVDVGYNPYAPRAGRALFLSKGLNGTGGAIFCASPGNSVSIDPTNPASIFTCPETYQPARRNSLLSRLTFHFGLGQAF